MKLFRKRKKAENVEIRENVIAEEMPEGGDQPGNRMLDECEQMIEAEAPMGEMTDFAIQLRALTQGRGRYTFYFEGYEEVPAANAQKIIDDAKREAEA